MEIAFGILLIILLIIMLAFAGLMMYESVKNNKEK